MIQTILLNGLPIMIAITFHEAAHGFVANRCGDPTAKHLGRLTLNPLAHIDPVGTVLLPLFLMYSGLPIFGYAKPVPVNFGRLRSPRRDMVLVALAGPAMNMVLAFVGALMLTFSYARGYGGGMDGVIAGGITGAMLTKTLTNFIFINIFLAVLNMLPIPPLDGGRVLVGLLPPPIAAYVSRIEPFGFIIVFGGLFLAPTLLSYLGIMIDPAKTILLGPTIKIMTYLLSGMI